MTERYPKDSSGRALVEEVVDAFKQHLLEASFVQRQDVPAHLESLDAAHPAMPFKTLIRDLISPGVKAELEARRRADQANKDLIAETAARIAAKDPLQLPPGRC